MEERLTASLFVSALVRRVEADGGSAYVAQKGDAQAGAIHILVAGEDGQSRDLYSPSLLLATGVELIGGRVFVKAGTLADYEAQMAFEEREASFDPDFWLIEIENWQGAVDELFSVVEG